MPWKDELRHPGEQLDDTPGTGSCELGAEEELEGKDEKAPI